MIDRTANDYFQIEPGQEWSHADGVLRILGVNLSEVWAAVDGGSTLSSQAWIYDRYTLTKTADGADIDRDKYVYKKPGEKVPEDLRWPSCWNGRGRHWDLAYGGWKSILYRCPIEDFCLECDRPKSCCSCEPEPDKEHDDIPGFFVPSFMALAEKAHQNAMNKGFWDDPESDAGLIALMHSELSEALDALRNGNPESTKIPGFSQIEEELADTVLRIMDFSAARGVNIADAIVAKHNYNKTRPHKHGKEF